MIDRYPLSWPIGWPRTKSHERRSARFRRKERVYNTSLQHYDGVSRELSISVALDRLIVEIKRMGIPHQRMIVSTNVELGRNGWPLSNRRDPDDPGVAVFWTNPETKQQQCMAIDIYDSVAGNIAAVAATLDAMRAIERHGGAQILKRAFEGFKALPSSTTPALSTEEAARAIAWRENGNSDDAKVTAAADMIVNDRDWARSAIRRAVSKTHPDAGGKQADFMLVQEAKRVLEAHHGGQL